MITKSKDRYADPHYHEKYYRKHKLQIWAHRREKHASLRDSVIDALGAVCAKCGYSDRRALQIDHVHGEGNKERRAISPTRYLKVVLADKKRRYQLLCANCNWIKRHERKEYMPHVEYDNTK